MSVNFDLTDRVAVVTGGASGIGLATVATFASAGATVVALDISEKHLAEAAAGLSVDRVRTRVVDVTSEADVAALASSVVEEFGGIDIWVNVAGIIDVVEIVDMTRERFDRVFDVNFRGALYGAQAAVRAMSGPAGRGGSIVNVVSAAIDEPARGLSAYSVSKAALTQLTRTLATEVGPLGIRVNAIAPGFVETAMTARHFTAADGSVDEDLREKAIKPMRRRSPLSLIGEPDDIAAGILYLCSEAAKFVTGEVLRVNGGAVMR